MCVNNRCEQATQEDKKKQFVREFVETFPAVWAIEMAINRFDSKYVSSCVLTVVVKTHVC